MTYKAMAWSGLIVLGVVCATSIQRAQPDVIIGQVSDSVTGVGLAGARVEFKSQISREEAISGKEPDPPLSTVTGSAGHFSLTTEDVKKGVVTISAPGYVSTRRTWPQKKASFLSIQLERPSSISGKLTLVSGEPVDGIVTIFVDHAPNGVTATTKTRQGTFSIRELPSGKANLLVRGIGVAPKFSQLSLEAGKPLDNLNVTLQRAATITGRVLDENEKPVNRAEIQVSYQVSDPNALVLQSHVQGRRITNTDGQFGITGIVPDVPLTLRARTSQKMTETIAVQSLAPSEIRSVDLIIR